MADRTISRLPGRSAGRPQILVSREEGLRVDLSLVGSKEGLSRLKRIPSPFQWGKNFIRYNWLQPLGQPPPLPRALCIYVTYRCNLRCQMCGIWKQNGPESQARELSLQEFDQVLSESLFSRLEYININGGEPNLRPDLPEFVELFIRKFPRLSMITMNSNGLPTSLALSHARQIASLCRRADVRFSLSLSLHDLGEAHDKIVGVRNAYLQVEETLRGLKRIQREARFYLGVNCVLTPLNLYRGEEMRRWGEREGIPVNFTLGEVRERFNNAGMSGDVLISGEGQKELIKFFKSLARERSLGNHHALRYSELAGLLEGSSRRRLSCHYAATGVILGSEGSLYYCKDSKSLGNCLKTRAFSLYYAPENLRYRQEELIQKKCRNCPPNTFNRIELEKDILKYLLFLIRN
jgi:MoaA/NifB/PqqE/SkfB family radical SAM enzyme